MAHTVQLFAGLDYAFKDDFEFYCCLALKVGAGGLSCTKVNKIIFQRTEYETHSNGR